MPLSKARDAERKRQERTKIRLDKQLLSMRISNPVQPKIAEYVSVVLDIDADGNIIPDYDN